MVQTQNEFKWQVISNSSEVSIKMRYLLTFLTATFKKFDINVTTQGENFATAQINFDAVLKSAVTGDADRDNYISSFHLLENEQVASLHFISTGMEKLSEHKFIVNGDVTLFGVTQPLSLEMLFDGLNRTPGDNLSVSFILNGKIKYTDFTSQMDEFKGASLFVGKEVSLLVKAHLQKTSGNM